MFTLSRRNKDKGYLHKIESRHKKAKTPLAKANSVSATYQKNQGTTNLQKEIRSPARLL